MNPPTRLRSCWVLLLACFATELLAIQCAWCDSPATTKSVTSAVYLDPALQPDGKTPFMWLFTRELYRQALLIAARDELGIPTRDGSLREWSDSKPPGQTFNTLVTMTDISVLRNNDAAKPLWTDHLKPMPEYDDYGLQVQVAESLSRSGFVEALRKGGFAGHANTQTPNAPAPEDSEARLAQLDEISQFAVLRETHAAIRADGESPRRLGVLVRAYANLAQLSRYHWSIEQKAYMARALLYSQRMVANDPNSAFAFWHRAYARAMAGMSVQALADLSACQALKPEVEAPPWVALLEPLCKMQPARLAALAIENQSQKRLALFLAFLTFQDCDCMASSVKAGQALFDADPSCMLVIEAISDTQPGGTGFNPVEYGPTAFSQLLAKELPEMPQMPQSMIALLQQLIRPEGNPTGREDFCQALIKQGTPQNDAGEPSWAALGRLIQEVTFVHEQLRISMLAEGYRKDAGDYARKIEPLIADHPDRGAIHALGHWHDDAAKMKEAMATIDWERTTLSEGWIYRNEVQIKSKGADSWQKIYAQLYYNSDMTCWDLAPMCKLEEGMEGSDLFIDQLKKVNPYSPMSQLMEIRYRWKAIKPQAQDIESQHGDYISILRALGEQYTADQDYAAAERCFRKYIALSPDFLGYDGLAKIYRARGQDDVWLATKQEYINKGIGWQRFLALDDIAQFFLDHSRPSEALPYAETAEQPGLPQTTMMKVEVLSALGDWATAERLVRGKVDEFSDSPFRWYQWCCVNGHGDIVAAKKATEDYLASHADHLSFHEMMQSVGLDLLAGDNARAIDMLRKAYAVSSSPVAGAPIIVLLDASGDAIGRDAAIQKSLSEMEQSYPLNKYVVILSKTIGAGPGAAPDADAIDTILKAANPGDWVEINYLTFLYLDHHGKKDLADQYLRRCFTGPKGHSVYFPAATDVAIKRGMDTYELRHPAALFAVPPATSSSTRP